MFVCVSVYVWLKYDDVDDDLLRLSFCRQNTDRQTDTGQELHIPIFDVVIVMFSSSLAEFSYVINALREKRRDQ